MNNRILKILSLFMSVIMIISSLPVIVFGATNVNDYSNLTLRWLSGDDYLQDMSSNSRNGNKQGNVDWADNNGYKSAKFNNGDIWYTVSNNLLSSAIASSVENGGAGTTIAFKAYVADNSSSSPFFCLFNNNYSTSGYKTLFSYAPNGAIVYTNSAGTAKYSNTGALSNGWHTIVIKFYSSKCLEIYSDNSKLYGEQSDFYDNHTFDIPNSIKIGVNRENTAYFNGCIRDFRIYNKAIDVNTVTTNIDNIANEDNTTIPTTGDTDFTSKITSSKIKVNFVQPQIGGISIENVSGRNYYRNILYCSNSFVANASKTRVNQNSTYGYILMPSNTIVLYDGVTAPIIPVKASFNTESVETGGYSYSTFASIYLPSTPAFSLDNTWIGLNTQNCNRFTGWPSNSGSTNQLGNTDVRSGNTCQVQSYNYEIGFKNGLVMNSIPSSNPRTSIPFRFNQTVDESSTVTSSGNIYYIDITTLNNEIMNAKTQAYEISSKYGIYSTASYSNYYEKTLALLNFDINANLQTTLGCSNAVSRMNTSIDNAINEYKSAYQNLKKKEYADLHFIDGSSDVLIYEEGSNPVLPDTNKVISNNDGTHSYLYWSETGTSVIDDIKHIIYTQTKTSSQNCLYTSQVIQQKSCTKNEITRYTCLACQHSYDVVGDKLEHNMVYSDFGNGTHHGICVNCHELSTEVYEEHSFSNYISNNNQTCTSNLTETSVCDKCSATNTREVTGTSLGHNYEQIIVEPNCTEKGYTKYVCTRCSDTYIDEYSYTNELNHNFVEKEIVCADCVTNGLFEYTCTRCNYKYSTTTDTQPNIHNTLIYSRTVSPTNTEDGYDIYYCSNLCGYWERQNIVPALKSENINDYLDAYNSALNTIIVDYSPYTDDSILEYSEIINNAKLDAQNAIDNQDYNQLECATKSIIEALSVLRIKTISVSVMQDNGEELILASYGESVLLNIDSMSKVTIEKDNKTTLLTYTEESIDYVAKDNSIIYITPVNELNADLSKTTYLDKNGKVIDIVYGDNQTYIEAPKIPFYTFDGWNIISNDSNNKILKANYYL